MPRATALMLALFCLGGTAQAEVVLLKNGDRLTGEWVRVNDGKLVFKAEDIGEVTIPVAKMKSFATEKVGVALLKNGKAYRGSPALDDSGDWVLSLNGGRLSLSAASVEAIYPQEVYLPREPEEGQRPWRLWHGTGNLGYSLVRGDSRAATTAISFAATRKQPDLPGLNEKFRTHYMFNLLFANTQTLSSPRVSANSASSGLRQDFLFSPTNFVFLMAQLDHIEAQSLNLRQTYGSGLGHDLLKHPHTVFSFLGGLTFVKEDFFGKVGRQNVEGLLGERTTLHLTERVRFDHLLNFYPALSSAGQYRFDSSSTLSTKLISRLALTTGFTDRYLSNPLPGHMKNELILTTGLGFNF